MVRGRISKGRGYQRPSGAFGSLVQFLATFSVVAIFITIGYFVISALLLLKDLPDVSKLEHFAPIEAIQIFDRNDHLICTVEGDEDRQVVPLNHISLAMQQAMLAAEDHHFYEHHGVNPVSIIRAFMVNMQARHVREGGSTITQQLVKNLFFSGSGRTIDRKIKEAILAYELERRYSKEKILELYFNQIYFGNGAYGIERAAYRYFGKSSANLSLAESAYLACLVKAPSELSVNTPLALTRQKEVLNSMVEYGYVTEKQAKQAKAEKLVFKRSTNPFQSHPYYISYVLEQLKERYTTAEMRELGLKVYTNLDPDAQEQAENILNESIKHAPKGVTQGALVSVSVSDGAVIALVGGVGDFWKNQWNRATNPHTAGSSFKPFVYLTAFIKGVLTPDSIIADEPLVVKQRWGLPSYCPKNFDHKFMGKIPVWKALAHSRNVCSVRIAQMVGIDSVIDTARAAGITTRLDPNLSLALGSSAVTPLDMAGAYSTFARGGVVIHPQTIRRIENNKGQVIESNESSSNKVFEPDPVAQLLRCMQEVVKSGTGTMAKLPDRPVAGKTGTADASKDIWFIGFTPDLVTALWAGNDDNLPIPGTYVTGGVVMAKIWKQYNMAYYEKHPTPPGSFITPSANATVASDKKEGEGLPEPSAKPLFPAPNLRPEMPTSAPDSTQPAVLQPQGESQSNYQANDQINNQSNNQVDSRANNQINNQSNYQPSQPNNQTNYQPGYLRNQNSNQNSYPNYYPQNSSPINQSYPGNSSPYAPGPQSVPPGGYSSNSNSMNSNPINPSNGQSVQSGRLYPAQPGTYPPPYSGSPGVRMYPQQTNTYR